MMDDTPNRCLIEGTLTTHTELHVGDGESRPVRDRSAPASWNTPETDPTARTVVTDHRGRAYIPGSTLKGVFRETILNDPGGDKTIWEALLGKSDASLGGKLLFFDAFLTAAPPAPKPSPVGGVTDPAHAAHTHDNNRRYPCWDPTRRTCVSTGTAIDRKTRTASNQKLFSREYVPAGEVFRFRIGGENLTKEERDALVRIFKALVAKSSSGSRREAATPDSVSSEDSRQDTDAANSESIDSETLIHLGAKKSKDWGSLALHLEAIRYRNRDRLRDWLNDPKASGSGFTFPKSDPHSTDLLKANSQGSKNSSSPNVAGNRLHFDLTLEMETPWISRDPFNKKKKGKDHETHLGRLDESGKPFLPSSSFVGTLRSQAEKILRTLGRDVADGPWEERPQGKAEPLENLKSRNPAALLFGFTGWKSPLRATRVIPKGEALGEKLQEFVAIDRFTGGAADEKKFQSKLADPCKATARLSVDLRRLEKVDSERESLGLLALVLRDLEEGDISLGAGSSKGQGFCRMTDCRLSGKSADSNCSEWKKQKVISNALKAFFAKPETTQTTDHR